MFRTVLSRFASAALIVSAAVAQPAWDLRHTAAHHDAAHESAHGGAASSDNGGSPMPGPELAPSHEHPTFYSPQRANQDVVSVVVATVPAKPELRPVLVTLVPEAFCVASARASPACEQPSQPRAPPLA
jgi:hypothetical protein